MNGKDKRFPLQLSSVVEKPRHGVSSSGKQNKIASSQTAARNAAQNVTRAAQAAETVERSTGRTTESLSASSRSSALVSNAVRAAMTARVARQGVRDAKVLAALDSVPRHLFVEPALASQAYIDASLPIGHHQTISQPYIVARLI